MPSLRDCLGKAGKAINPSDAEDLLQRARQYVDDGYSVDRAERMALHAGIEESRDNIVSIYRQVGVKMPGEAPTEVPGMKPEKAAPATESESNATKPGLKPLPEGTEVEYLGWKYPAIEGVGKPVDHWRVKLPGERGEGAGLTAEALAARGYQAPEVPRPGKILGNAGLFDESEMPFNLSGKEQKAPGPTMDERAAHDEAVAAENAKQPDLLESEDQSIKVPEGKTVRDMERMSARVRAIDKELTGGARGDNRVRLLEERLQIGAEMGHEPSIDAIPKYEEAKANANQSADPNAIVQAVVKKSGITKSASWTWRPEIDALTEHGVSKRLIRANGASLDSLGEKIAEQFQAHGLLDPEKQNPFTEGDVIEMIKKAYREGPQPKVEPPRFDLPLVKKPRGPLSSSAGFISPGAAMSGPGRAVLGGVTGGAIGATQGNTPEEKLKNMLKGALIGGGIAYGVPKLASMIRGEGSFKESATGQLVDRFTNAVKEKGDIALRRLAGEALPITSSKSAESGDAVVRYVASIHAAAPVARSMATDVLGDHYQDKAFDQKLGAVAVEERLRGIKAGFEAAAERAKTPEEAAELRQKAANVKTLVGGEGGKFKNEADYQSALNDPDIRSAIDRHIKTVQTTAEEAHTAAGGKLAGAGPQTGMFVNLQAVLGDNPESVFKDTGLNVGDIVKAPDRKNFGRVIGSNPDGTAQVHFINPDTLSEAQVGFHPKDLEVMQTAADAEKNGSILPSGGAAGARRGNLENPLRKGTAFGKQAAGTAEEYNTSYRDIAERMVKGNFEEAAKRNMYDQLVKDGLAVEANPGEKAPEFNGKKAASMTIERRGQIPQAGEPLTKIVKLYYDPDIAGELRQALDVDGPVARAGMAHVANIVNKVQLAAPTDAIFHTANQIARIAGSQGGGSLMADLVRMRPGVNVVDAVGRMVWKAQKILADSPEIQRATADLARIGALRQERAMPEATWNPTTWKPSGRLISLLDKSGRLVGNDMFQNLVDRGLVDDSEGARRDFINKMGNYDPRLMGQFQRFFKDSGFSPFIVAGRNFNRLAMERVMLDPGVRAANTGAAMKMRAVNLAGAVADLLVLPAAINYMRTGNPMGRPGTPFAAIDTGKDDERGNHIVIDPQQWTLMRRGLRLTGLNALATGLREGQTPSNIAGNAARDSASGIIHPWVGPMPKVAATMLGAPRPLGSAKPGATGEQNIVEGAKQISPLSSSFSQGQAATGTTKGGVKAVLSSWGSAAGIKAARPFTPEDSVYRMLDKYHEATGTEKPPRVGEADYSPLKNALRGSDADSQKAELDNLAKTKSPQEIAGYFVHSADHPFTGDKRDEAKFVASLSPEEKATYDQAVEDRRATAAKGISAVRDYFNATDPNGPGKALADQASNKFAINQGIHEIVLKLKTAPPERKAAMIQALAQNPTVFKAVENQLVGRNQDLEPSDESIAALGVENGARANYIRQHAASMQQSDRQAFLTHLAEKRLLNGAVMQQLAGAQK